MQITLTIPDDKLAEIQTTDGVELARRWLAAIGVELYRKGALTRPQLQEMLGLKSRVDLDGVLKSHGVFFDYSDEELAREAETIRLFREARGGQS